jgi:eukaryotic-like serine/threonine-protein kinase
VQWRRDEEGLRQSRLYLREPVSFMTTTTTTTTAATMMTKLGPRYRIVAPLASGGMGEVLLALAGAPKAKAFSPRDATPVAIKQLHAHLADDPRMVEMFVDEARIASRLLHPNIVHVKDVEMIGESVVLVMDYIEGVSLSLLLRLLQEQKKPMPVPVARRIVHDVLLGLHSAHEAKDDRGASLGIIHRDVSPQNVLLGVDGIARIADFGVAKARGRLANTQADGTVKGKLQYLAPEQIYRKPVDRRADVFSTGIVLWECLAGRKLFLGESEGETLARVISEPILPPSNDRFDVTLDLDEVCLKALERKQERRYATAEDFARALESAPLASRAEIAALVLEAGHETIDEQRALIETARTTLPVVATDDTNNGVAVASAATEVFPSPKKKRSLAGVGVALAVGLIAGGVITSLSRGNEPKASTSSSSAPPPPSTTFILPSTSSAAASAVAIAPTADPPTTMELPATPPSSSTKLKPRAPQPAGQRSRPSSNAKDAGANARNFEPTDL